MKDNNIHLTIITASYNSSKTIKLTFESILNQTYRSPFEYIVIDGLSSDNTVEIIKEYEPKFKRRDINFKWISEKDNGIFNAWNKGLDLVTGNWVAFIGSDDYYHLHALDIYSTNIIKYNDYDFIASKLWIVNDKKEKLTIMEYKTIPFTKIPRGFPSPGSFHNAKVFREYGNFDESFKIAGDFEFLTRIKNIKFHQINECLSEMMVGGVSNSLENRKRTLKELKLIQEKNLNVNKLFSAITYNYFYYKNSFLDLLKKFFGAKIIGRITIFLKSI